MQVWTLKNKETLYIAWLLIPSPKYVDGWMCEPDYVQYSQVFTPAMTITDADICKVDCIIFWSSDKSVTAYIIIIKILVHVHRSCVILHVVIIIDWYYKWLHVEWLTVR